MIEHRGAVTRPVLRRRPALGAAAGCLPRPSDQAPATAARPRLPGHEPSELPTRSTPRLADLRTGHGLYAEAATGWTETARLIAKAGESGDAQCLVQAGTVLGDVARIERAAMEALRRLRE